MSLSPEKIVYVSCNPETLARDLAYLTKRDYQVKKIQPVDMFPVTDSIETVVCWAIGETDHKDEMKYFKGISERYKIC